MATKATGAEFKLFYNNEKLWQGKWHEDEEVTVDGVLADAEFDLSTVADESRLTISHGYVANEAGDDLGSFEGYFRKWRKAQATAFLAVEVPLDKVDAVKAAIIKAGGKCC